MEGKRKESEGFNNIATVLSPALLFADLLWSSDSPQNVNRQGTVTFVFLIWWLFEFSCVKNILQLRVLWVDMCTVPLGQILSQINSPTTSQLGTVYKIYLIQQNESWKLGRCSN